MPKRRRVEDLHPLVYGAMIACPVLFALGAGGFLAGPQYGVVVLGVVAVFAIVTIAIPLAIRRIWAHHPDVHGISGWQASLRSLKDWRERDMTIWQGRMKASDAAIMILLPLAAPCAEAVLFLIVFYWAGAHAGH